MELKLQGTGGSSEVSMEVLIVPLWNWNDCHHRLRDTGVRSNRTFMELKLQAVLFDGRRYGCSNRTFMELKFKKAIEAAKKAAMF